MTIIPGAQLYPVTNPPPSVAITEPTNGAAYTGHTSVSLSADAAAQYNTLSLVNFYLGSTLLGGVSNPPYSLTTTGPGPRQLQLDGSGRGRQRTEHPTSAPVNITIATATGQPYGLTNYPPAPAFYNMPPVFTSRCPRSYR